MPALALAVLAILFSRFITFSSSCALPSNAKPSFVESFSRIPGIKPNATAFDDYWVVYAVQPVVLGYFTKDGINYMVGGLKDQGDDCTKVTFVISGNIQVNDKSGIFDPSKVMADKEFITIDEFKWRFPKGTQVSAKYLGDRPRNDGSEVSYCDLGGKISEYYCSIQRASELFSSSVDGKLDLNTFNTAKERLFITDWSTNLMDL